MKIAHCEIYSNPFDRSLTPEHHGVIQVRLYFAGDKVIKVETDSRHMFAEQAVCALLAKYLGKSVLTHDQAEGVYGAVIHGNQLLHPLSVVIPRSIVEQRRIHEATGSEISSEPKPFQLEAGKFYRNRTGETVGPMRDMTGTDIRGQVEGFPFIGYNILRDRDLVFAVDGKASMKAEHDYDLIEEVAVPVTQPEVDATTRMFKSKVFTNMEEGYKTLDADVAEFAEAMGWNNTATTLPPTATDYLHNAAAIMEERGKQYDQAGGERSMGKCINAFNTITGHELSEAEGWLLLQLLKDVRQWQRKGFHRDSADDCIAYAALKAEAKQREEIKP